MTVEQQYYINHADIEYYIFDVTNAARRSCKFKTLTNQD